MNFINRLLNYSHELYIHSDMWKRKLNKKINTYYLSNSDDLVKDELEYISENGINVFNYEFSKKYYSKKVEVLLDEKSGLRYIYDASGHKLFFSRKMSSSQIVEYYRGLLMEQDDESPHKYLDSELINKTYNTVLDLGGAEGNFSLSIIEKVKDVYIFECDEDWIEALNYTFEPWKDKVHIVNKFVSNVTRGNVIKLDDINELKNNKVDLIKMDIEGEELKALQGAGDILRDNPQCTLLVCVYHNAKDYDEISHYLNGYNIQKRENKILFIYDKKIKPPFFRYGVIKAYR